MQALGVHSEVGKLRTVMACRPGLATQRAIRRATPEAISSMTFAAGSMGTKDLGVQLLPCARGVGCSRTGFVQ